ncbi:hypothetical protein BH23BAC4_BH23BAC4_08690 [soil metagenome]
MQTVEGAEQVYLAGRQLTKLRIISPLCILCGFALLWAGWTVLHSYGLHPSEGGVLAPVSVRIVLGGFLMALGAFIVLGIVAYTQLCYVSRIDRLTGDDRVRMVVAGFLAPRSVEVAQHDLLPAEYHGGIYAIGRLSGATPYYSVRLRDRWLPLIIDLQGELVDPDTFGRVFSLPYISAASLDENTRRRTRHSART